jgi:hypothetical protein
MSKVSLPAVSCPNPTNLFMHDLLSKTTLDGANLHFVCIIKVDQGQREANLYTSAVMIVRAFSIHTSANEG